MDYNKILSRGSEYLFAAGDNWSKRKQKLIKMWYDTGKPKRIFDLTIILEDRICKLGGLYHLVLERKKKQEREAEEQIVMLECPNFECQYGPDAVVIAVKMKDFTYGGRLCGTCRQRLQIVGSERVDDMLGELGVYTV